MNRRNYLAGAAAGTVFSATTLFAGCLDNANVSGADADPEGETGVDDETAASGDDSGTANESDAGEADSADTPPTDGDDGNDENGTEGDDQDQGADERDEDDDRGQDVDGNEAGDSQNRDGADSDGDDAQEQNDTDDDSQPDESDDDENDTDDDSSSDPALEPVPEVVEMTPSLVSGTEFEYLALIRTADPESGSARLVDSDGHVLDSTSYETTPLEGQDYAEGGFGLLFDAPETDAEIAVRLTIETDHGDASLGDVTIRPAGE